MRQLVVALVLVAFVTSCASSSEPISSPTQADSDCKEVQRAVKVASNVYAGYGPEAGIEDLQKRFARLWPTTSDPTMSRLLEDLAKGRDWEANLQALDAVCPFPAPAQ